MENQLSVIAESVVELSSSFTDEKTDTIKHSDSDENFKNIENNNKKISDAADDNHNFFMKFHNEYENIKKVEVKNKDNNSKEDEDKVLERRLSMNLQRSGTLSNNINTFAPILDIKSNLDKQLRKTSSHNDDIHNVKNDKAIVESPNRKNFRNLEKNLRRYSHKVIMDKLNFGNDNINKDRLSLSPKNIFRKFSIISPSKKNDSESNIDSLDKVEGFPKMKYSNSIEPELRKRLNRSNSFNFKLEKKNFEIIKNKQGKKNILTIDQVVEDINKNVITFSKRRSTIKDGYDINKHDKNKKILKFDSRLSIKKTYPFKQSIVKNSDRESTIRYNRNFIKRRIEKNFRRLISIIHIITFISFVKKEIIRYGIVPTKFKPLLECDNNIQHKAVSLNISNMEVLKKLKSIEDQLSKTKFKWYIILPESNFRKIWEKVFLTILVYFVTIVPYRVSYTDTYFNTRYLVYFFFDVLIEFVFFLDIILNCLRSHYDAEGNLVSHIKQIIYIYFTSLWLIFDLACLCPIVYSMFSLIFEYQVDKTIILFQYFRSIKLYLIVNSTTFVQNMEDKLSVNSGYVKLLVFLINTIFACHMFSCLFYYCAIINNFNNNTWVYRNGWLDEDKISLYLKSLYFAFTSYITVGYGDIVAFTTIEIVFVLAWLLFSGIFYTSSLTSLSKIFLDYSSNKFLINNKCMIVSEIFKKSKIPLKVEKETIKFLKISYSKNKEKVSVKDIKNLLSEIPMNLRYQIATEIYDGAISRIPILSKASKSFISNILPLLQSMYVLPNNYVYQCDEVPHKIYFISEGKIKIQTEDLISFTTLTEGNYFGEIEILRKTYRELNAKAIDRCLLLTLSKNIVWDDIMKNHIDFMQYLIENMIKRHSFYERMQDIVEVLIEQGKKLMKKNEMENKKTLPVFTNYKKNLFFISLAHNIENGMNESELSKLNELLNISLVEDDDQIELENTSNLDPGEIEELYKRKERRRITKLKNKEDKINSRKSGKNFLIKDNIMRMSSKSLRSKINLSIEKRQNTMSLLKMLQGISEVNDKIYDTLKMLNKKIDKARNNSNNYFSDLDQKYHSKNNNGRVPKNLIEKLKELNRKHE